jgi:ABC-2 type transport system permease protein
MIALISKDFSIQKKSLIRYLIVSVFFIFVFAFALEQQLLFALAMFPIIYGFLDRSLYEDEKNNTLRLLVSLPIKKELIIYSKYISTALMISSITIVFSIISKIFIASGIWKKNNTITSTALLVLIMIFVILISLYLPVVYKIGYIRAAGMYRFVLMGIFALAISFSVLAKDFFATSKFINVYNFATTLKPLYLDIIILLLISSIYVISMKVSSINFNKRNLF